MFLVDDILNKVLDYFFNRVEAGRSQHDSAIKSIRVSMRALASSLNEITLQLESGVHRLKRHKKDDDLFFQELQKIVDADFLNNACNESGICKELRIAQDELYNISPLNSSENIDDIATLANQIETFEASFVEAIREFLSKAKGIDLTSTDRENTTLNTDEVVEAFEERLRSLSDIHSNIENLLKKLRESSY